MLVPDMTMVDTSTSLNSSVNQSICGGDQSNVYYDLEFRIRLVFTDPHDLTVIIIGLVAITLNILVLVALYRICTNVTSHYRLIISVAVSDIVVGGSVMLHIMNKTFNPAYVPGGWNYQTQRLISKCTFLTVKALYNTGLLITLLNLMAMAADHYIAIMHPLRHVTITRKSRVITMVTILWLLSIILGFSDFLSAIKPYRRNHDEFGYNYCEVVWLTFYREEFTVLTVALICFIVMFYIYLRIYLKIRSHRRPGEDEHLKKRGGMQKTKKALITTLLNLGTFMVTWLPVCLFEISLLIKMRYDPYDIQQHWKLYKNIEKYLVDLLMVNSIADSVIYTVRIREVQVGLRRMFPCFKCLASKPATPSGSFRDSLTGSSVSRLRARLSSQKSTLTLVPYSANFIYVKATDQSNTT